MTDLRAAAERIFLLIKGNYNPFTDSGNFYELESILREVAEEASEHASASANRQWDKICFKKIAEARSEMREEAAKIAEGPLPMPLYHVQRVIDTGKNIAIQIRALKP